MFTVRVFSHTLSSTKLWGVLLRNRAGRTWVLTHQYRHKRDALTAAWCTRTELSHGYKLCFKDWAPAPTWMTA